MSYKLDVLKDNPVGLWLLDETSGSVFYDSSQYSNNGVYYGTLDFDFLPIVSNGVSSKLINSETHIEYDVRTNYFGDLDSPGFATKDTSDNDFSIEVWIYPTIGVSPAYTPIFADKIRQVGIFWQYGNIVFKLEDKILSYAMPNVNQAFQVVAVYSVGAMFIYVNGELVTSSYFEEFSFSNTAIQFKSGPSSRPEDKFLIDCASVYRYALNSVQVKNHYISAQGIAPIQIASPDSGQIFQIYDNGISRQYQYVYPLNKSWSMFDNALLQYSNTEQSLYLAGDGTENLIETSISDVISVPLGFDLNSSKIEWKATDGVEVYASIDNVSFFKCKNGFSIPKYRYSNSDFNELRKVYLSIRFSSQNTIHFNPRIYDLIISFYNDKSIYPLNGGAKISHLLDSGFNSNITFGNYLSPVLMRNSKNGLICSQGSGFNLNTKKNINTIEFFYTPSSTYLIDPALMIDIVASGLLVDDAESASASQPSGQVYADVSEILADRGNLVFNEGSSTEYSWGIDGVITSTNIAAIYVNRQNKTSETNIHDVFKEDRLHHVVIFFEDPVTDDIKFNYSVSGCPEAVYQNIAIYELAGTQAFAEMHYDLWTGRYVVSAADSSMSMTENSANAYSNDWVSV
jgi:hypothetical protein